MFVCGSGLRSGGPFLGAGLVQNGEPDRIADLLEEAAAYIELLEAAVSENIKVTSIEHERTDAAVDDRSCRYAWLDGTCSCERIQGNLNCKHNPF